MPTLCKVSCRCVVGLMLFEHFLCRICPTIIWVCVQFFPGSCGEFRRGVCVCKDTWHLCGGCLCNPASWNYSSDGAAAPTPAMPANLQQAASAQRECTKVSLPTVMPAPPFLLSSCRRPLLESGTDLFSSSSRDSSGTLHITHCKVINTCLLLGYRNETWPETWIVVNEDLTWY